MVGEIHFSLVIEKESDIKDCSLLFPSFISSPLEKYTGVEMNITVATFILFFLTYSGN